MDIYSFLIQLLNGVQYGLLLFLVASGLTLIFGIMGIINLAHGSFYMVGAYMAFTLSSLTGNLFVAIVVGVVLSVLLGIVLEWALISHLYKRDHLEQVLLTYGLILVFEELRVSSSATMCTVSPSPPSLAGRFRSPRPFPIRYIASSCRRSAWRSRDSSICSFTAHASE
jgi:branched-chain amino acid transport system permease protein